MRPSAELIDLVPDARTSVDRDDVDASQMLRIFPQILGNLDAEFPGRTQHKSLWFVLRDDCLLQQRKAEGCRLAGTCLGKGDKIMVRFKQIRNHFFLDRHRGLIAELTDCAEQFGHQAQVFKCLHMAWIAYCMSMDCIRHRISDCIWHRISDCISH